MSLKRVVVILSVIAAALGAYSYYHKRGGDPNRDASISRATRPQSRTAQPTSADNGITETRPKLKFETAPIDPNHPTFSITDITKQSNEATTDYSKVRHLAAEQWSKFLKEAEPSDEQQQLLLSAIYDAQLYLGEVYRAQDEWALDKRSEAENPVPDIDVYKDIQDAVGTRAQEILTPAQFRTYTNTVRVALIPAVVGGFVGRSEK